MKRPLLAVTAAAAVSFVAGTPAVADRDKDNDHGHRGRVKFELVETTIPEISAALKSRVISAERLTRMYLKRIEAYEETGPAINAYLLVNDNAVREARQLDALHDRTRTLADAALRRPRAPQGQHRHGRHADHRRQRCAEWIAAA